METYLKEQGWVYVSGCRCGGVLRYSYRKGDYKITIRPGRKIWTLFKNGRLETSGTEIDLQEKIKGL